MNAPYRNVHHALSTAYALENIPILRISSALRDLRAEGIARMGSYYQTPWDRHAQAVIVFAYVYRHCHQPEIIECKYRRIHNQIDMIKKLSACMEIAKRSEFGYDPFTLLAASQWAGIKILPGWLKDCVQLVHKSKRTLWRLRNKIFAEMDVKLDRAIDRLEIPMEEAGLIDKPGE